MRDQKCVLVVEDDEAIRFGTQLRLKINGYEVVTAVDGREGLAKVRSESPDLVIMDIRMPHLDGLSALAEMKEDAAIARIPVVIASASPEDQNTALDTGAKFFLRKPFSNEALLAAVESACHNPLNLSE